MEPWTPIPLPPPPIRTLHHRPPLPEFPSLSRKRTRFPPNASHVTVLEISDSSSTSSSPPSSPTSPGSSSSSPRTSPALSAPKAPTACSRELTYLSPSPTPSHCEVSWNPVPRHVLRRKVSPKNESLRSLRAKDSDACLQRIYDQQTVAYLNGTIFSRLNPTWED